MSKLTIFTDGHAYPTKAEKESGDESSVEEVSLNLTRSLPQQNQYRVLILGGEDQSLKRTLEGLMEALTAVGHGLSMSKPKYEEPITENGLHLQFAHMMREMANLMGYTLNCTSWKDQEMKVYDRDEFIVRLKRLQAIIENQGYR